MWRGISAEKWDSKVSMGSAVNGQLSRDVSDVSVNQYHVLELT
jgi:hypothetical protein